MPQHASTQPPTPGTYSLADIDPAPPGQYSLSDVEPDGDWFAQFAEAEPSTEREGVRGFIDRVFTPLAPVKALVDRIAADYDRLGARGIRINPLIPAEWQGTAARTAIPQSPGDIALTAGGPASRIASVLLAARGGLRVAEGESLAERGAGGLQALLGLLGIRAPRSSVAAASGRPSAGAGEAPAAPFVSQLLNTLRGRNAGAMVATPATPPAAATTAVPDAATLQQTIDTLRRATARSASVSRGFAEPPISVRTGVAAPPQSGAVPARVVEAVAARPVLPAKPHYTAADVVEHLRQLEAARAVRSGPADVVLDSRLAVEPSVRASQVAAAADSTVSPSITNAALLRGRRSFENTIPRGTPIPDEMLKDLDVRGVAYRDADRAFLEAQREFAARKIDAPALQSAKLARRQAGKDLRNAELRHREALTKPLAKDAGVIAPDVVRWMGSTAAGATAGAAADEEHPIRGAIMGGLLGAAAPGTVAGIRAEGARGVVKAYVSGLLSGPPTHIRNLTSTTLNGLFRWASHPAAVAADAARSTLTATPRELFLDELAPSVVATFTGARRGVSDALKVIRTGNAPYSAVQGPGRPTKYELPGGLSNPMNWPTRALLAMDTMLGRTFESQALAELAYATARKRGLTGLAAWRTAGQLQASPPPALLAAAEREASRVIFREVGEGRIAKVVESVEHLRDQYPLIGIFAPFVRVPAAIMRSMIEATPAGLLLKDTLNVREQMERAGRMFTGSLLLYQGANYLWEGRASGAGPRNPVERSKLMEEGWRPYAVNLRLPDALGQRLGGSKSADGTYWVSNNALGPLGMLFSAAADLVEGWSEAGARDDADREDQIVATLGRLAQFMTSQTFLNDATELAESLQNPDMLQRYVNRKAQGAVPMSSLMRTVTRAGDPIVRQPETIAEAIREIIPGQSESVPSRLDRFGEDVVRPTPEGALAYIAPPVSPVRTDEVLDLLKRTGARVGKPTGRMQIGDFTPPLSREEERDLVRSRGALNKRALQLLAQSDTFRAYPPEAQKLIVERLRARLAQQRRTSEIINLLRSHPEFQPEVVRELQRQGN